MAEHTVTPAEWAELKSLWTQYEEGDRTDKDRLLAIASSDRIRLELERLIAADDDFSSFVELDRCAHELLGFSTDSVFGNSEEVAPSFVGRRIGPYRILSLIGRGGMGAVYMAERADDAFQHRVAIKTVWRGADSEVLLQRFRTERQILAQLQHPNIAQLIDGGATEEGTPWLAMEYVEGTPIDAWCDEHSLPINARLDLFRQVCAAVHHAHQRLVIHRDLKPTNILVTSEGVVKLLDFGVAKLLEVSDTEGTLTSAGLSPFTASYAAPEQVTGGAISTATDVCALGAILTTLLAGEPPLKLLGLSPAEQLLAVSEQEPRPPSSIALTMPQSAAHARGFSSSQKLAAALRGELDAIALTALRRDPARRYHGAAALSDDIHRYLRRDRVLARPDSTLYRIKTFLRRRTALAVALAIGFLGIAMASLTAWYQASVARAEAARAEKASAFLSGIVTGANATSYDPIIRLSTPNTLAELVDSTLVRVPREFPNDDRIRARLYTAIGSNVVSQSRYALAFSILDSARILSARSFGERSAEYARACLEEANLRLTTDGPSAAAEYLASARAAIAPLPSDNDLHARLALVEASRAFLLGQFRLADSLARSVATWDTSNSRLANVKNNKPAGRTILSLRAEAMIMDNSSWRYRDPRVYLKHAKAVLLLADSLGLRNTQEQLSAWNGQFEAYLVLGRTDEALAVQANILKALADLPEDSPLAAFLARNRSFWAAVAGDTATQRIQAQKAIAAIERGQVLPISDRVLISNTYIEDALSRGDTAAAHHVSRETVNDLVNSGSPMVMSFAYLFDGQAAVASGNPRAAIRSLQLGLAEVDKSPELWSMRPRLRRVLASAYDMLKEPAVADSIKKLDPPKAKVPPCTPGGEWKGCPLLN